MKRERCEEIAKQLTEHFRNEMRNWCLDCAVNDDDYDDIFDAPLWQIVKYVDRCYDGGVLAFIRENNRTGSTLYIY